MSSSKIPQLVLKSSSNQCKIPVIAFGTAAVTNNDGEITKVAVIEAIKSGYRHFDTALIYGSEEALGEAIAEALQLGLIQSRDELFITSMVYVSKIYAIKHRNLKLEYLDLYLIHFPITVKPGNWEMPYAEELITTFDLKGVWTAMEECQKLGFAKSIGVSNFTRKKLDDLLSFAKIPPSVNQVRQ
ncbi:NADPH-dependent codeinone reductase 1-4-like [Trifolium pratense]|uniref:NADPH-dependent codeinone reductase 1-4-like n=1 Tax=Trifolium pratense TaxID=57577 RepID=UPI001E6928C9|nr:NADPH-dependent codeinone reductase 1-4-like [Trifolium pratense]